MDLAIIMPVFGQGPFLCESITSALDQRTRYDYRVVLVDDACPQQETVDNCRRFARAHPDRVLYWRSPENRGLSAMRNEGVRLALERWPDLFAVTSFDGDDRLHPLLVERGVTALREAQEEAVEGFRYGWVFEDPDHFGVDGVMLRTRAYSSLFSMAGCSNTPTSPMLADIFRSGVRFREEMKAGSEDWQFWLSALKSGFRGKYVPKIGFRYRRRPGSMAYYAHRRADRNRADLRLSLPELFHPDFYLKEEAAEAPRYGLASLDPGIGTADGLPKKWGPAEFLKRIAIYDRIPTTPIPQHLFFAADETIAALRKAKALDHALWRLEMMSGTRNVVGARIAPTVDKANAFEVEVDAADPFRIRYSDLICVSTKLALELTKGRATFEGLRRNGRIKGFDLRLGDAPQIAAAGDTSLFNDFHRFINSMKEAYGPLGPGFSRHGATNWKPFGVERYGMALHFFGAAPLLSLPDAKDDVLIVSREEEMERPDLAGLAISLAGKLRSEGRSCTLLVLGSAIDRRVARHFDRLLILPRVERDGVDVIEAGERALLGLLLPFGTVISVACASIASDLNQLRRYGRNVLGVLPELSGSATEMHEALIDCFKVFKGLYCMSPTEMARAEGLGVAPEQIVGTERELLQRAGGREDIPE